MPGSPETSTIWPSPAFACSQRRISSAISSSRPTSGVVAVRSASNRLSTALGRSAAQARTGSANALEFLGPKILKLEQIAEKLSRALGDDDRVRLGDRLAGAPQGLASRRRCRAPAPRPIRSDRRPRPARWQCRRGFAVGRWTSARRPLRSAPSPPVPPARRHPRAPADSRSRPARRRPCTSLRTRRSAARSRRRTSDRRK